MIKIYTADQYEAVLIVLAMMPDEYERTENEHVTYAELEDAKDNYEDRFYPICEVVE